MWRAGRGHRMFQGTSLATPTLAEEEAGPVVPREAGLPILREKEARPPAVSRRPRGQPPPPAGRGGRAGPPAVPREEGAGPVVPREGGLLVPWKKGAGHQRLVDDREAGLLLPRDEEAGLRRSAGPGRTTGTTGRRPAASGFSTTARPASSSRGTRRPATGGPRCRGRARP